MNSFSTLSHVSLQTSFHPTYSCLQKYHKRYEQLKAESNKQKAESPVPIEVDQSKELASPSKTPDKAKSPEIKPRGKNKKKEDGLCIAEKCFNAAVHTQERGDQFCSNECVVKYCR